MWPAELEGTSCRSMFVHGCMCVCVCVCVCVCECVMRAGYDTDGMVLVKGNRFNFWYSAALQGPKVSWQRVYKVMQTILTQEILRSRFSGSKND